MATTRTTKAAPSKAVSEKVAEVIDEMKAGTLHVGRSAKKVTDRKQAIAIGLSEARAEGKNVPPKPKAKAKAKPKAKAEARKS